MFFIFINFLFLFLLILNLNCIFYFLQVHFAFSRDQDKKVYVTHLLKENADELWRVIGENNGHLYVCGWVSLRTSTVWNYWPRTCKNSFKFRLNFIDITLCFSSIFLKFPFFGRVFRNFSHASEKFSSVFCQIFLKSYVHFCLQTYSPCPRHYSWSHPSALFSIIGTKLSNVRGCSPISYRVIITSSWYSWNAGHSNKVCQASSSHLLSHLVHSGLSTSFIRSR